MWKTVSGWIERHFTWKGIAAGIVWIIINLPDWVGRKDFWKSHVWDVYRVAMANKTIFTLLICALVIWLDHRTVLSRQRLPVADAVPLPGPTIPALPTQATTEALPEKLEALAKDVFAFLARCGKEEGVPSIGYLLRVHDGFMLNLYAKVETMSYELGASGVVDFTIGEILRKNANAFSYRTISEIAEALLAIKHKLELKAYKDATLTGKDVAGMTSADMKQRMSDPDFVAQVNALANFKQPLS